MQWIHSVVLVTWLSLFCMKNSLLWKLLYIVIIIKQKQQQNYETNTDIKATIYQIHE